MGAAPDPYRSIAVPTEPHVAPTMPQEFGASIMHATAASGSVPPTTAGTSATRVTTAGEMFGSFRAGLKGSPPLPLAAPPVPNENAAQRYAILSELGRGGMGVVLKGHDRDLNRDIALKILRHDSAEASGMLTRFLAEARISGRLQHPGVVPVYDLGALPDRRPYIAMKLVEGQTLHAMLRGRKSPGQDLPRFLAIFEHICQTVAYAHNLGIIHRDLKPLNIMVGAFGEVQVMDWGLAKEVGEAEVTGLARTAPSPASASTTYGQVMGTPAYMPPEQARGEVEKVGRVSDVFSLGAILCEILTGAPPYGQTGDAYVQAVAADLTDAQSRLQKCGADADLVNLATRCLDPDPSRRPRSASEVASWITDYLASLQAKFRAAETARATAEVRAAEEQKRRRTSMALATVLFLVIVGGGIAGMIWWNNRRAMEAEVVDALTDAEDHRQAGRIADARARLELADGRLAGGGPAHLRDQFNSTRSAIDLQDELDQIRLRPSRINPDLCDMTDVGGEFARVFQSHHLDLLTLSVPDAAQRIQQSPLRDRILAALTHWSVVGTPDESAKVRAVLDVSDPDAWRAELRRAAPRRDLTDLRRLAADPRITSQPEHVKVLTAMLLFSAGAPADAIAFLKQSLIQHPDSFWIHHPLAVAYTLSSPPRLTDAVGHFRASLAIRPHSPGAHVNFAYAMLQAREFKEAERLYRHALELAPDTANAHHGLGVALRGQGRLDEAEAEFRTAIQQRPKRPDFRWDLVLLLRGKNPKEADAQFKEAVQLPAQDGPSHAARGIMLVEAGQRVQGVVELQRARSMGYRSAMASRKLADELVTEKQFPEALEAYREAIKLDPSDPESRVAICRLLVSSGQVAEALAEAKQASITFPNNAVVQAELGKLLAANRDWEPATAALRRAIELAPDETEPYFEMGRVMRRLGRFTESLQAFRRGHRLASRKSEAPPSAEWVYEAEHLRALDLRLTEVLAGMSAPSGVAEMIQLAGFCREHKAAPATAARFYAEAFTHSPSAATPEARFQAATAAIIAALGTVPESAFLTGSQRRSLRSQALEWLSGALDSATIPQIQEWKKSTDLAYTRGENLKLLPTEEQAAWQRFWSEVERRLQQK